MSVVLLTIAEIVMCAQIGTMRQIAAIQANLPDRHGYDGEGWNIHIEGACGEYAFCKDRNITWRPTINTFRKEADVGKLWEVKTRSRDDYDLIVRPDDVENRSFILVTGRAPSYTVRGWMIGKDAKRDEWWQTYGDRPGAWFVPQEVLLPIAELVMS